jgi:hypothetical protein
MLVEFKLPVISDDDGERFYETRHIKVESNDLDAARALVLNQYPEVDPTDVYFRFPTYINVYEVDRQYGGPEEGGWYYNVGTPVAAIPCNTEHQINDAYKILREQYPAEKRHHRIDDPYFRVVQEAYFPEPYPKTRPHYE